MKPLRLAADRRRLALRRRLRRRAPLRGPVAAPVAVINAAPMNAAGIATSRRAGSRLVAGLRGPGAGRPGHPRPSTGTSTCAIALDRVREARAVFSDVQRDQLPAGHHRRRPTPQRQPAAFPSSTRAGSRSRPAQLGFDAAWEIDLFGRVRHGIEAADATAGAARSRRRVDAQVTVAAEVARNYFELRGAQARLAVAKAQRRHPARDPAPDRGPLRGRRAATRSTWRAPRRACAPPRPSSPS